MSEPHPDCKHPVSLEIAIASTAGAIIAQRAGADQLELCSALELGGVTPAAGLIDSVLAASTLPVHVLVRPRPGDFCYSPEELETALQEAAWCARQGASGVVIGALTPSGQVDLVGTARLIEAARSVNPDLEIVFHRAIEGLPLLIDMVRADSGLQIMAGGGVLTADIPALLNDAGVAAVHLSAKMPGSTATRAALALGSADGANPNAYFVTNETLVREAVAQLRISHP